jgi:transposase
MLYAGLDVHKEFCQAIVLTKEGELVREGRVGTERSEIAEFFKGLAGVKVAYEASGNYEYFYEVLSGLGHEVKLAHPLKTRLIAEAKVKTDKIDARALADLLRADLLPTSYVPPEDIRELRHLVRQRIHLGRHRARLKNQIYAVLRRSNLKYPGTEQFTKKGIEWLRGLKSVEIDSYLVVYDAVVEQLNLAERQIEREGMKLKEVKLLVTIPGIGPYSATIIHSEIGDIQRFGCEEKLYSHAGLVPSVYQSGESCHRGRLTGGGSKILRWILVEIVQTHIRYAPDSKITLFYKRMRKKKPANVAKIATARKLLQAIYHMLRTGEEFRG